MAYDLDNAVRGQITVSTTPQQIFRGDTYNRSRVTLQNMGSVTVYLGDSSSVSSSTAFFALAAGDTCEDDGFQGNLWVVTASSTAALGYESLPPAGQ